MTTPPSDHHRCNDCGYPLKGLAMGDDCPECGRSVARSLQGARAGSAWQRSFSVGETEVAAFVHTLEIWEDVRPERAFRSFVLLVLCCFASGVVVGVSWLLGGPQTGVWKPVQGLVVTLMVSCGLVALSLPEACGLSFIGWRRGGARTPEHVLAVVAHASPGWLTGSVLVALVWQVLQRLPGMFTARGFDVFGLFRVGDGWPVWVCVIACGGVGLLWFESLAYRGMLRLRFASR